MTKKHLWTDRQAKAAKIPNFGKKYIVEPNLLKLIGSVRGKKILEFGSGSGYWLELFSKRGAKCYGIEIEKNQIALAIARDKGSKIEYITRDITQSIDSLLKKNYFDIVLLEHVLLEIPLLNQLEKIFQNAFKFLKKGGTVIVSDLHPFAPSSKPRNIKVPRNYHYFFSGSTIKAISHRVDGKQIHYTDIHWTLEDLVKSITKANLVITNIEEPHPSERITKKYKELSYRLTRPMSIMIKAKKL